MFKLKRLYWLSYAALFPLFLLWAAHAEFAQAGRKTAVLSPPVPSQGVLTPTIFANVNVSAGVSMTHQSDFMFATTGQAWGDYNNDGWLDLYLTNRNGLNALYHNNGDGSFALSALSSQVALPGSLSSGAVWGDYNNDGWIDLYVQNEGVNALFQNINGAQFINVAGSAGVGHNGTGETAVWGDYDQDGNLDLYLVNRDSDSGLSQDILYHNNGDGTFTDVSAMLADSQLTKFGFTASFVDYDNDGDSDLYVVNDKMQTNALWRNDGAGCGHWCFTDVSISSGANTAVDGMGIAVGDYDNDGDLDFAFTDTGPLTLLQNQTSQGSPTFVNVAAAAGVDTDVVGWGVSFFDYNNDGWLDIYQATMNNNAPQSNRLFHNNGDGTFSDVTSNSGAANINPTYGTAYADYDNDGFVDLLIGNRDVEYTLYHNEGVVGATNHWLRVHLVGGGAVNQSAVGSRVTITTTGGMTLMQEVKSGSSIGSGNMLDLHFGLGADTIEDLTIRWPDGLEQQFNALPIDRVWTAVYPTTIFADVTASAGISMPHHSDWMPFTTGQAWGDYDNDGWQDLYLTDMLSYNVLYHNNQDGTFDVSPLSASVALTTDLSSGAVWADYNNDGWIDLYVLNDGANALFRNDYGMQFTDVTISAGVGHTGTGQTAAWGDYDQDGYLDIYVANRTSSLASSEDALYHNNGDGTFTDVASLLDPAQIGKLGFTVSFLDYDNDSDADIYVVNDRGERNVLWRNDGAGCGGWCFTDVSVSSGADVAIDGMGIAVGDYDNDHDLDIFASNGGAMVLLQNQASQGSPIFYNVAITAGVDFPSIGWGAGFFDYDNDGLLDLYLSTMDSDPAKANRLFHNEGDGTFSDVSAVSGASTNKPSFGNAYADYDHDGQVDLVVGNRTVDYTLFRNQGIAGSGNHWLQIHLMGGGSVNQSAVGSRVYLTATTGITMMQEMKSGSSIGSGNMLDLHFGLGAGLAQSLRVVWSDGLSETFDNVPTDQVWSLAYPVAGVDLASNDNGVIAGDMISFTWTLLNSGTRTDGYTLTVDNGGVTPVSVTMLGAQETAVLTVTAPVTTMPIQITTLTAVSVNDPAVQQAVGMAQYQIIPGN